MKKIFSLMFTATMVSTCLMAQIPDGIKYLNYEKNKSAQVAFQKAYDANPKDPQAIYWLGQSILATDGGDPTKTQILAAKAVYQKGLQEVGSDPWLLVGMGHVEILEGGDINSVKQKFEQAITASTETKGKNRGKANAGILNAIGRANAEVSTTQGDHVYAIDKLKQAALIDLTDPDIYINMGINYLKLGGENGGEAVKAYQEAINRDPKSARAMYRIGKIYQSQNNKDLFELNFNNSIVADPAFAPSYFAYYLYYADRDVNKAKEYLDKFVGTADKDPRTEFFLADYLFRSGKNAESIAKLKELEASAGASALPRLNIEYALNYDRMGDSVQAKANLEKFFATAAVDKIVPADYELAVKVLSKFPGSESQAVTYIQKALQTDTVTANKISYMNMAADLNAKAKNYTEQLNWLKQMTALKKDISNRDYFFLADAALRAKKYDEAIIIGDQYIAKYPDQLFGYRAKANAAIALDVDSTKGTALPAIQQYIDFLMKDSVKNAKLIKAQYYYIAVYYADKTKDFPKALEIVDKILAIDPEDSFAKPAKEQLVKALSKPSSPNKTTRQAPQPGGTKPGGPPKK